MQLIIKNQTANPLSYVQGEITVSANGTTSVPREYNVLLTSDATFLSDALSGAVVLNNGSTDLTGPNIQDLSQILAQFSATPLATMPLYYSLPVDIRQSAATTSGSTVWTMRNSALSTKIVVIERIFLTMSFDGTTASSSLQKYNLKRFNSAAPTTGTSITPVSVDSVAPVTNVTDARYLDTGLSIAGIVFDNTFCTISCAASNSASTTYLRNDIPLKLAPGEGLAIQLNGNAIVGQGLCGEVVWSER